MVTFANWLSNSEQVRRVTLLNSSEPVLAEEVITKTKKALGGSGDFVHIASSQLTDSELWDLASQNSLLSFRMLIIREAELIKDWSPIKSWLELCRPNNNYLLFAPNWTQDTCDLATIKLLRQRTVSVVIDCKLPNLGDTVKWIKSKVKTDDRTASYLVEKAGGDLLKISNLCSKLNILGMVLTNNIVDALITEASADSFVDSLVLLDKKSALLAIEEVSSEDYSKIIGQLASRLIAVGKLNKALRVRTTSEKELAQRLGNGYYWVIRKFVSVAPRYDENKRMSRHRVLAIADDAVQQGVRDGVLEVLVNAW